MKLTNFIFVDFEFQDLKLTFRTLEINNIRIIELSFSFFYN